VLTGSNIIISFVRKWVPDKVRIPCYITIIATFVTVADLLMKAYAPLLNRQLGIFVPLIVVNCIILARAESYASQNNVRKSALDGIAIGCGFALSLVVIAAVREVLGSNRLFRSHGRPRVPSHAGFCHCPRRVFHDCRAPCIGQLPAFEKG